MGYDEQGNMQVEKGMLEIICFFAGRMSFSDQIEYNNSENIKTLNSKTLNSEQ